MKPYFHPPNFSCCYSHIRQLRYICPYLDTTTACTIAICIIHFKLDYCNYLYYNLPKSQIICLKQTLAPAVVKAPKTCYITSMLHSACLESVGGPSGSARGRQPQFRCAEDDGRKSPAPPMVCWRTIRSFDDIAAATKRRTTSRLTLCGAQLGTSAVSRILVTTSGEFILLPVWDRHPKLNLGRCPLTWYSNSNNLPLFSHIFPAFRTFKV